MLFRRDVQTDSTPLLRSISASNAQASLGAIRMVRARARGLRSAREEMTEVGRDRGLASSIGTRDANAAELCETLTTYSVVTRHGLAALAGGN